MEKHYDPKEVEPRIQKFWQDKKIFKFDEKSKKPLFSIDTPPPTISGKLHLGHAMSYTQFEIIARYKRLRGFNVFFPIGFDDNGHPTERYIEKKHKIDLNKISKKEFVDLVKKEIKEVEETYKQDLIRLGHSHDWSLLYRTISDKCAEISQRSFIDLFEKKLVYRSEEPTIWCPFCQTALSQADVEDKERKSSLNYINFSVGKEKITIATSRPELLAACVAVFVNPDDKRYKKLVGKKAKVPIFGQEVPIKADEGVDPDFGTGIVMVCTFGDNADIDWWRTHKLPSRVIVGKDGKLNDLAGKYKGLDLKDAKKKILEDLGELIEKKEDLEQTVGTCWRCHEAVEYIITKQWFVKLLENKEKFIELGKKVNWYPNWFIARYEDWIKNLKWDWLISRQRHHGISVPVWYCKKCETPIVPEKEDLPVDPEIVKPKKKCKCGSSDFEPDKDVFDTWMTSSMTPQLAFGWEPKIKNIFPETLRPNAHDIIRTWVFYTIVKSHYHFKDKPWENVMISGHALDPKGKAMHKSLGNIIEPIDMINKYNADALRSWAASVTMGFDVSFQEKELVTAQKRFVKLWNASRFVEKFIKDYKPKKIKLKTFDKWLLTKLSKLIEISTKSFDSFEPSIPKTKIEYFFWHEFCDNYLEIVKHRLYNGEDEAAKYTLYTALLAILKLLNPIIPHITEEIYQKLFKENEKDISICISNWPEVDKEFIDEEAEKIGDDAKHIISEIRQTKSHRGFPLNKKMDWEFLEDWKNKYNKDILDDIKGTTKIEIKYGKEFGPISEQE